MIRVPYLHPSRLEQEITVIWPPTPITASPGLVEAKRLTQSWVGCSSDGVSWVGFSSDGVSGWGAVQKLLNTFWIFGRTAHPDTPSEEQPTQLTPSEEQPTQLTPSEGQPTQLCVNLFASTKPGLALMGVGGQMTVISCSRRLG